MKTTHIPPMKLHHAGDYQPDLGGEPTAVIARLKAENAELRAALEMALPILAYRHNNGDDLNDSSLGADIPDGRVYEIARAALNKARHD